ncbi:MAG TPA: NAD(P)H-dependent glycerol-3-phosphate dehydrogenase [Caldithrix abyssi]|uniref:Glycerol-3-phosphate dehydrogenase [NAD(P)+] n=1 Tax=Caldithrix abyssi TaxID=187145 RepID=A0A7V5PS63_CALAY|nr:NAD(P)H-dependent glycerol-3-phosphate dehydrogenase [Caldithrix abyssi]
MNVAIIGAGSWGTALGMVLNQNGHRVRLWTIEKSTIDDVNSKRENSRYLPGVKIPEAIEFTMDLAYALQEAELIVNAVPSQVTRKVVPQVVQLLPRNDLYWVTVSKGIENNTYKRISEVIAEVGNISPERITALSGPSHAEEVSRNVPTAVVAACKNLETARLVQKTFMTPYFRVYASDDIIGVELGGALKNIIALAAGICDGAGFGDNTKAALMTRGLVEMNRMGAAMGARPNTFAGLSGMGDLIVTCMSRHSRNRHVGEEIGKGRKLQEVLDEMVMVAEGVKTTLSAYELAKIKNVEMPITEQIYLTLFENKSPHQAMLDLMTRESKIEDWG